MKEISKMKMLNTMCIQTSVSALSLLAAIALVGLPTIGNASMTVTPGLTVRNNCAHQIIIAVHYKDSGGNWRTTSFISIPPQQQRNHVVSSNNSIFYYYAETTSPQKTVWRGDQNFNVDGKMYPMRKTSLNKENNRFYLGLKCK
ncbi:MAG TPA: DUF1036 domain-containing protein [Terrimicrobiaceae bacterium]